MKVALLKLLLKILGPIAAIVAFYFLPQIIEFVRWLVILENTDFGFPIWVDWTISIISGIIACRLLDDLLGPLDEGIFSFLKYVISVVVGFAIHAFLKYLYIEFVITISVITCYTMLLYIINSYKIRKAVYFTRKIKK